MLVEDNIVNTSYWGIQGIDGNDGLTIRRNTIYGKDATKATYWGINIGGRSTGLQTKNVVVEENTIYNAGYGPISVGNYGGNVGNIAIRNITITVQAESGWNIAGIKVNEISGTGQPLPSDIVVTGNSVNVVGSYTGVATVIHGIAIGGSAINTMVVTNNVLNYGAAASVETISALPSAVIVVTNAAPYTGVLKGDTTISGNTITGTWNNGVAVVDMVAMVYGNIQAPATVTVIENFPMTLEYGIRGGAGESIDAKLSSWGDPSGPSGGVVDPESGKVANGSGVLVSGYVIFYPWEGAVDKTALTAGRHTIVGRNSFVERGKNHDNYTHCAVTGGTAIRKGRARYLASRD
jgi:hypothetical protein